MDLLVRGLRLMGLFVGGLIDLIDCLIGLCIGELMCSWMGLWVDGFMALCIDVSMGCWIHDWIGVML